ncbi:hypothetical protein MRX96_044159 [Rhipicephalus microplus]
MHTGSVERILVMGATNTPQELDDATLRLFVKLVYVRLPDENTWLALLDKVLRKQNSQLSLDKLSKNAALDPIKELNLQQVWCVDPKKMRNITLEEFITSLKKVGLNVSSQGLEFYERWNHEFNDKPV